MPKKRFRHYFVGTVHPRSKFVQDRVADDIPQDDLDAMELRGVPVTVNHPPEPGPMANHPNLVRGEIIKTIRGKNGEKLAIGYIDHTDIKGCWLLNQIEDGFRRGLSLSHSITHRKDEHGRLLPKPEYRPDHVAIVETPRRPGCFLHAIKPPANCFKLRPTSHTSPFSDAAIKSESEGVYVNASADTPVVEPITKPLSSRHSVLLPMATNHQPAGQSAASEKPAAPAAQSAPANQDRQPMDTGNLNNLQITTPDGKLIDFAAMDKAELLEHLVGAAGHNHEAETRLREAEEKLKMYEQEKEQEREKKYQEKLARAKSAIRTLERLRAQKTMEESGNSADGQNAGGNTEDQENAKVEEIVKILNPTGCKTDADVKRMDVISDIFTGYCEAAVHGEQHAAETERKYQEYVRASQIGYRPEMQKFGSSLSTNSAPKRKRMSEDFRTDPAPVSATSSGTQEQPKSFNQFILSEIYKRTPQMTQESGSTISNKMKYLQEETLKRTRPRDDANISFGYPSR